MKKSMLLTIMLLVTAFAVVAQSPVQTANKQEVVETQNGPKAEWDTQVVDLGDVPFRQHRDATYTLTNTGNEPLLITSARASCGCTNLKYSQEPVLPGKSTEISVTFNGTGNGPFRRSITINTNASERPTHLQITGTVIRE